MKLHGNAALNWRGRRRLAQRVVSEGWTLTTAAEAAVVREPASQNPHANIERPAESDRA
jgi:hypothetical protein